MAAASAAPPEDVAVLAAPAAAVEAPLLAAVSAGGLEDVLEVIASGCDIDAHDQDGISPLMFAAYRGDEEVCQVLLEARADVHRRDRNGLTPLMHGAAARGSDACKVLLQASAEVDAADNSGRSVMMHAVESADGESAIQAVVAHEVCALLLARRANIDHQDANGCTALILATIAGSTALMPLLLAAGADPKLHDSFGSSALDYAKAEEHELIAELLSAAERAENARIACEAGQKRYKDAAERLAACEDDKAALDNRSPGDATSKKASDSEVANDEGQQNA